MGVKDESDDCDNWTLSIQLLILMKSLIILKHEHQLTLNLAKAKYIVFKRPIARCCHLPRAIENIEQLYYNKLLGVFLVKF